MAGVDGSLLVSSAASLAQAAFLGHELASALAQLHSVPSQSSPAMGHLAPSQSSSMTGSATHGRVQQVHAPPEFFVCRIICTQYGPGDGCWVCQTCTGYFHMNCGARCLQCRKVHCNGCRPIHQCIGHIVLNAASDLQKEAATIPQGIDLQGEVDWREEAATI